jgi:1,4-dihydroxy-2-naphthoyl-CoA hydrolase
MSFDHTLTVRFHEADRAGIAFFGRVFEYCHTAFEEMLMAAGDNLASVFDEGGWGMPLVHVEADYARPMKLGERLVVSLEVERVGNRSVTFGFRVIGEADGEQKATVQLIHAFAGVGDMKSREVPERLLEGLRRLHLVEDPA